MKKTANSMALAAMAVLGIGLCAPPVHAAAEQPQARTHSSSVAVVNGVVTLDGSDTQVEDRLFDGAEKLASKAKDVSEVNLDKSMLNMAARKGGQKGELAQKLDFVVVRNYGFAKEGDYNPADIEAIMKKLDGDGWKHVVRTREGKELTDICLRQDGDGVTREIVIISAEPKEISLIHLKGNNINVGDMHGIGGMASYAMHGSATAAGTTSTSTSSTTSTGKQHP